MAGAIDRLDQDGGTYPAVTQLQPNRARTAVAPIDGAQQTNPAPEHHTPEAGGIAWQHMQPVTLARIANLDKNPHMIEIAPYFSCRPQSLVERTNVLLNTPADRPLRPIT